MGSFAGRASIVPTFGSGWIAYATWDRPTGQAITHDSTDWIVPPAPSTSNGQVIFLFNGIQADTSILQPVLQWGTSAAGGGTHYDVACWYLQGAGVWYGTLVSASPGDTIHGAVDSTTGGGDVYKCGFTAPGGVQGMWVSGSVPELTEAVETLEAYGITACTDYPNTTLVASTNIRLKTHAGTPTMSWTAHNRVTDCDQKAAIVSNANPGGEVDIYFRDPPPTVYVSGPDNIATKGTYTWTANPGGGNGSFTYQWVLRPDGGSNTSEGTSSTQSSTVFSGDPNFWWIVTVTSAGMTAKDSMYVYNCIGIPDCGP